jgi:hypothetical protein
MSLPDIIAAAKDYDGGLKGKASELAAVLLKVRGSNLLGISAFLRLFLFQPSLSR